MTVDGVPYKPNEFLDQLFSGEVSNNTQEVFINVLTKKGVPFAGKFLGLDVHGEVLFLRSPCLSTCTLERVSVFEHHIAIKKINTITKLGSDYLYRSAHEISASNQKDLLGSVTVYRKAISGLISVRNERVSGDRFYPIAFQVRKDPSDSKSILIEIGSTFRVKLFDYSLSSLTELEKNRYRAIREAVEYQVPIVLILLIEEYAADKIFDRLPSSFLSYVMRRIN